ncbi:MAG: protein translocase subunit SecF [Candidatus Ancillula sp.]|jgi:preprotein translocase subunit SecF|nr:protein translocase subunit SecF [Candidatus Ancillula sp.]
MTKTVKARTSWGNALYTGEKSYDVVKYRWRFYAVSIFLCLIAVVAIGVRGLNLGIDFTGGSEFTISGTSEHDQNRAIAAVHEIMPNDEPLVSSVGNDSIRVQTGAIDGQDKINNLRDKLAGVYGVSNDKVSNTSIGPTWGASVGSKALEGLIVFLIAIALFMTMYFRSIQMAVGGIVALLHDLIITVGVYAIVGWEITPASVIGFLTILGYSMYDTVVVFDKVRENTRTVFSQTRSKYSELANLAVNQTLVRSINTSVVALLPIGAILFFGVFYMGAGTLRDIALALFVGMAVGAYSSVFLATPLEVSLRQSTKKIKAHNQSVEVAREEFKKKLTEFGQEIDEDAIKIAKLLPGVRLNNSAQPKRRKKK